MKGFLKNIFGLGKSEPTPIPPEAIPPASEAQKTQPIPPLPATPQTPNITEAYLNRKKGRKKHRDSLDDLKKIVEYIAGHGEVSPGELSQTLGMSRSTLTYSLNRLLAVSPEGDTRRVGHWKYRALEWVLGQRYLVKKGAGKHVHYRLAPMPASGQPKE
jgi:hypothetical protein